MTDVTNDTTANDGTVADTTAVVETTPSAEATPTETKPAKEDNSLDAVLARNFDKLTKKKDEPAKAAKTEPKAEDAPVEAKPEDGKDIDPVSGRVLEPVKAPVLPPSLREKWKTVPREFQQYWADRERDMAKNLQETSEDRKLAASFKDVAQPYEAMLRQYNISATDHAKNLFKVSYALTTGNPQQKAEIFYQLLNDFKPDPATLQALIARQPIPQGQQQQKPVDIKAEVENTLKAREEETLKSQGIAARDAFAADPKNEFFDDVRDLMAKAIDAGFVQGSTWPELLKNAYDFACQQHPEVKSVLAGRVTQTAASTPAAAAKPAAVPSIKPSLGAGQKAASPKKKMTVAEAAEYAWQQAGGE